MGGEVRTSKSVWFALAKVCWLEISVTDSMMGMLITNFHRSLTWLAYLEPRMSGTPHEPHLCSLLRAPTAKEVVH